MYRQKGFRPVQKKNNHKQNINRTSKHCRGDVFKSNSNVINYYIKIILKQLNITCILIFDNKVEFFV